MSLRPRGLSHAAYQAALRRNVESSSAVETSVIDQGGRFITSFVACPTCRLKAAMTNHTTYQCGGCGRRFTSHEGVKTYAELVR